MHGDKSFMSLFSKYIREGVPQTALYLHFPLSMKNLRKENFVDKKSPLSMENLLCLSNVLSMKCPIFEMSYR